MPDNDLLNTLTELSNKAFGTLMELNKAKHISAKAADFFDLRDVILSESDKVLILTGYGGAAMDYEISHDYILRSVSAVQGLCTELEGLRNQLIKN